MADVLRNLSDALAATVATAGAGVVRVEARGRIPASGILWSPDGSSSRAHHVVEREENIGVGLPDGQTVAAALVGRDPTTDLAVLRADAKGLTQAAVAEPDSLRVDTWPWRWGVPGRRSRPPWASSARWAKSGARRPAARWTPTCRLIW